MKTKNGRKNPVDPGCSNLDIPNDHTIFNHGIHFFKNPGAGNTVAAALDPGSDQLEQFSRGLAGQGEFKRAFINSLIVSSSTMLLCILLGTFAAYGTSRFNFKGKKLFLFLIIITQMFSAVILIAPMYKIMTRLDLLNSYLSLIIPNTAFSLPMTVWLLYGYLEGIPISLEEAAMMDGCSRTQAVFKVLMPLLAPGMITSGLFAFIVSWNDLLFAQTS